MTSSRAKYFIKETYERPVSKKEFIRKQEEGLIGDCVLQSSLLRKKVFTKSQIKMLVSEKILVPVKYKAKVYFKKDDILKGVKYTSEPPKLFSL